MIVKRTLNKDVFYGFTSVAAVFFSSSNAFLKLGSLFRVSATALSLSAIITGSKSSLKTQRSTRLIRLSY